MRYTPSQQETETLAYFNDNQILEYFLTRVFETEEVWGLDDGADWIFRELENDACTLPLWPYEFFAKSAAVGEWREYHPEEASLEEFLYNFLQPLLEDEELMIELMPGPNKTGCIISPQRLFSILEGMLDAGEYRLDG